MRILPAGVDARDVLLCQWLQVAHRGWARNARRNTIPAPAISPRALSRFPVSDAVVAGLTDSDRTPWARMLPSVIGISGAAGETARLEPDSKAYARARRLTPSCMAARVTKARRVS